VEFEEPRGCRIVDMVLEADTDESFEQATAMLGLAESKIRSRITRYGGEFVEWRHAHGWAGETTLTVRGPERELKVVPADD
jgi:hypothetical protein